MSTDNITLILAIIWLGFGVFNLTKVRKKMQLSFVASIIFPLLGPLPPILAFLFVKPIPTKFPTNPMATKNAPLDNWSVVQIIETKRVGEPLGTEVREIDNSKSEIQVVRKFTVSREYVNVCTIDYEKVSSINGDLSIGVAGFANIKASLEKKVSEKYSISNSQKRTYTEEITLTIPAKKKVMMNLNWKQIWQHGIIRMKDKMHNELEIPFRVSLEPTFDQQQIDS